LGSGLGSLADSITDAIRIPYQELPGFPPSTVVGHAGQLVIGKLGGVDIACMQGRMHIYEGHSPSSLAVAIRTLKAIGCQTLFLTNAAGSLDASMGPGSLMMLNDHINFTGLSPLIGPNDEAIGPRFFDMVDAYDPEIRHQLSAAAEQEGMTLHEGVYLWTTGPAFETPAEIRMFRMMGANAVGMSTVPECLVARHCGMDVVAISTITNLAAGMGDTKITHDETLEQGKLAADKLIGLITRFLAGWNNEK